MDLLIDVHSGEIDTLIPTMQIRNRTFTLLGNKMRRWSYQKMIK